MPSRNGTERKPNYAYALARSLGVNPYVSGTSLIVPPDNYFPYEVNDRGSANTARAVDFLQKTTKNITGQNLNSNFIMWPLSVIQRASNKAVDTISSYAKGEHADELKDFVQGVVSGNETSYVPYSNSAAGVADGTFSAESSIFSDYEKYLDYIRELNSSNNAFNIEQAQKQMDFQAEQNKIIMDFNAAEAEKSRQWQSYMSDTAHQREMADLKAAGLNPILAVSGGSGASIGSGTAAAAGGSPSGARASADTAMTSAMLSMFNSAMDIAEKNASAAITANAVAARGISSNSSLNLKNVLSGARDLVNLVKLFKSVF